MAVWAEDEEIVCVHPTGPRLAGLAEVRASWERIFAGGDGHARPDHAQGRDDRNDAGGAQRPRKLQRTGWRAAARPGRRHQRVPAQRGGLAHDRAPRLSGARPCGAAKRRAQDPALSASPYRSPWWLCGGHMQTIYPALLPAPRVQFARARWETPDGDFVDVDWAGNADAARLLVLFHGLEGSSGSHYARSLAAHATALGWACAVPHFRGCSGEPNRLPRAYHSGDSERDRLVVAQVRRAVSRRATLRCGRFSRRQCLAQMAGRARRGRRAGHRASRGGFRAARPGGGGKRARPGPQPTPVRAHVSRHAEAKRRSGSSRVFRVCSMNTQCARRARCAPSTIW